MFARVKKTGQYEYLQIVQNRREGAKTIQRVVATIGRIDQLQQKGEIESLVRSLSRFSEKVLLVLSGKSDVKADAKKIGTVLICERLWKELGIGKIIISLLANRKFEFDVERAIFLTVLHRLFVSGSDRSCNRWHRDYVVNGADALSLHHLYRAMAFLGEELEDQKGCTPFASRCTKDVIEEDLFLARRDLFGGLDCVFFDTTSIYFEGEGGATIGALGHSKDHRPDLNQMVVGVILDEQGQPVCSEMWPGNTTDVKTLVPVIKRLRSRFAIVQICIVSDRGMISAETMAYLEEEKIPYILGARMRQSNEVKEEVLSRAGRYREVHPEGAAAKDPSPLKVKEVVLLGGHRYCRVYVNFAPAVSREALKAMRQEIGGWHIQLKNNKELVDLSAMFNPILSGWMNYYGRFYASAMFPVWNHMNGFLIRWLMRKHKSLAWHKRRAKRTLGRLAEALPSAFVHWKAGYTPMAG